MKIPADLDPPPLKEFRPRTPPLRRIVGPPYYSVIGASLIMDYGWPWVASERLSKSVGVSSL